MIALVESLQLTEEEKVEFIAISEKYGHQLIALKEGDGSKISKYFAYKSISKSRNEEMEQLLSEEQFKLYLEKQEAFQDKMQDMEEQ